MTSFGKLSATLNTKLRDLSKLSKVLPKLQLPPMKILKGTLTISATDKCEKPKDERFRRYVINKMGHFKYGLYTEDLIMEDIPAVKEAVKRLPPDVYDARAFRLVRAILLDARHELLPKEEWITYEADRDFHYLTPYIIEVELEKQEKRDHGIFC